MSESSQNNVPGPPKRFLKKGEGLKRFAAYKPPLPLSGNKMQRRQTFVKFKLDNKKDDPHLFPPKNLFDESVDLYTEVPKVAPPKIMRTPLKPLKQSLFMNHNNKTSNTANDITNNNANNIATKIANNINTKNEQPDDDSPLRYNLRRSRRKVATITHPIAEKKEPRRSRRQMKAVVERHISPPPPCNEEAETVNKSSDIDSKIDHLMEKIEQKKTLLDYKISDSDENQEDDIEEESNQDTLSQQNSNQNCHQVFDLSTPSPGTILLAFGKHLQEIQNTVNELKNKIDSIEITSSNKAPQPSKSSRKASRTKQGNCNNSKINRPSANADNLTPRKIENLRDRVAHLGAWFEEMNI